MNRRAVRTPAATRSPRSSTRRRDWPRPRRFRFRPATLFLSLAVGLIVGLTFLLSSYLRLDARWRYLIAINLVTLLAYAYDKLASAYGWLRIPERLLHLLAAAGGTPAAWVGQYLLRHKTQKESFRRRFWLIVVVQVVAIAAWIIADRSGWI